MAVTEEEKNKCIYRRGCLEKEIKKIEELENELNHLPRKIYLLLEDIEDRMHQIKGLIKDFREIEEDRR